MQRAIVIVLLVILAGVAFADKEAGMDRATETNMEVRVESLGPFVFGGCPQWGAPSKGVSPAFSWDRLGEVKRKHGLKTGDAEYGVCVLPPQPDPEMNFYYAASVLFERVEDVPDYLFIKVVPRQTFAVFTAEENTTGKLIQLWGRYQKWLPNSGYERADSATNIEKYSRSPTERHEIWIPIVPKRNK
jgi:predicted transcriptional regulator YdeE